MRRIKITLAYDGGGFHGWQVQPGLPTVQGALEQIVSDMEGAPVHGCPVDETGAMAHLDQGADGAIWPEWGTLARSDTPVECTDLVAGGEDVGEHQQLFVRHPGRGLVGGGVGEGHPYVLGLRAVDLVTEDPAATAQALTSAGSAPACRCTGCGLHGEGGQLRGSGS